jgi:hypothetical protein
MKLTGVSFVLAKYPVASKWRLWVGRLLAATIRPRLPRMPRGAGSVICDAGIRFDIAVGPLVRPIAKLYHWRFWKGDKRYNPWNGGGHWFVLKIPFAILPFVSVMFGQRKSGIVPGFYIGGRTADLSNKVDWQLRLDWNKSEYDKTAWAWNTDGSPIEAWPVGKYKNQKTIELSMAIRSDFSH